MLKSLSSRTVLFACLTLAPGGCGSPAQVSPTDVPTESSPEPTGDVILATDVVEETEAHAGADAVDLAPEAVGPQCEAGQGCFLDPCTENVDCQSGWCVQHLGEGVCSMLCQEECPLGWKCQQVAGSAPDLVYVCVSLHANLCRPCSQNSDCTSLGGAADACISYQASGSFCSGPCGAKNDCPWGFSCQQVQSVEGASLKQCVNDTGDCPCTASSIARGLTTPCAVENEHGKCTGKRMCQEGGLSSCDAGSPAAESCNGLDDDCDGDVDEPDLVQGDFVNLCEDGNDCTADKCSGQEGCVNETLGSGACNDGNPCTVADHCVTGQCVGDPVQCDDENPCTDNVCTDDGGCQYPPNEADCDDGDPCTLADVCQDGVCGGISVPCDCLQDPDCEPLEDGDLCNGTLICDTTAVPYQCIVDVATVVACEPPQGPEAFCLKASCDPAAGDCTLVPDHEGQLCESGNACVYNSKCSQGTCASGLTVNCNDGNPCTDDSCDPVSGCVHTDNQSPCQDVDECTVGDQCSGGVCQSGPKVDCDDANVCTLDSCVPGGLCVHEPAAGACDDANACTTDDACKEGLCMGGGVLQCVDDNPCTDHSCDPLNGCVTSVNSAPCDDGSVCTVSDHCHLGACISSSELVCNDGNACTDDSCGALVGCQFVPNQAACDDGNPCTLNDHCAGGWCIATGAEPCDDQNACTKDTCVPAQGCQHTPVSGPCDDGSACTLGDSCVAGACKPSNVLACDDGNPCTDDSCDGQAGCVHSPNGATCSDGDVCTDGDGCVKGQCVSGPPIDCNDGKECTKDSCEPKAGCKSATLPDYTPCGPAGSWICLSGTCVDCQPACAGKQCGDDGCGGTCGTCAFGEACLDGLCIPKHLWSKSWGGFGNDFGSAVAASSTGAVCLGGKHESTSVDFGGGGLPAGGYVACFNANGSHVWSKTVPAEVVDLAFDSNGYLLATGAGFLARYSAEGTLQWSSNLGGGTGTAVAADGTGNVFVTGYFGPGPVNLGGGSLACQGNTDVFLAKYSSAGAHSWSKAFGSNYLEEGRGLAVAADGSVFLAAVFKSQQISVGTSTLQNHQQGLGDVFLARFSSTGDYAWCKGWGGTDNDEVHAATVGPDGNVTIVGELWSNQVDFGAAILKNNSAQGDVFAASFGGDGTPKWAKDFGGGPWNTLSDVASDKAGNLYLAGFYGSSSIDFGGGSIPYGYASDIFVVRLDPTGGAFWWKTYKAMNNEFANAVAVNADGDVFVAGELRDGSVDFGGGKLAWVLSDDIFLLKLGQPGKTCVPTCAGKECGPDGCGGACGTCAAPGATCVGGLCQTAQPVLYFTDVSKASISRVNVDGTGLATLISGGVDADDLDLTADKMYWPDNDTAIRSANLDGSGILSVLTGKPSPYGIALDVAGGKIYWTNQTGNPKIQRSNLDGSNVETVLPGSGCCTSGIALDVPGGRIYWADGYYGGSISRCGLDGNNVQLLATTAGIPTGVALDLAGGKVYWTEYGNGNYDFVKSANLDGTGAKTLLSAANGLQTPQHIVIHSPSGKMYFTDLHAGKVYQANLDGSGLKAVVSNLGYPRGIALH